MPVDKKIFPDFGSFQNRMKPLCCNASYRLLTEMLDVVNIHSLFQNETTKSYKKNFIANLLLTCTWGSHLASENLNFVSRKMGVSF